MSTEPKPGLYLDSGEFVTASEVERLRKALQAIATADVHRADVMGRFLTAYAKDILVQHARQLRWSEHEPQGVETAHAILTTPQPAERKPLTIINLPDGAELRDIQTYGWALYRGGEEMRVLSRFEQEFINSAIHAVSNIGDVKRKPQAIETVAVPLEDLRKLVALTNFNSSALAASVAAMASEWLAGIINDPNPAG